MKPLAEMTLEVLITADGRTMTALSHRHAVGWRAARADDVRLIIGTGAASGAAGKA